jgi:hypothetical protein
VVAQLKNRGKVTRGWIGVQVQQVTPDIANQLRLREAAGALVTTLQSNSPAARSPAYDLRRSKAMAHLMPAWRYAPGPKAQAECYRQ